MLSIILTLFPLLVVVILLLMNYKTTSSMLIGIITGFVISVITPSAYSINFNIVEYLNVVVLDNFGTLLSIYVLNLLMYLITESTAIESLSRIMRHIIKTPRQVFAAIPLLGCLLSQDDYLSCMAGSTIITPVAEKNGIQKENIAFLVNITSVTLCCIFPVSSWNPVIKSALTSNGFSETLSMSTLPMNLTALLSIVTLCYFYCRPHKVASSINNYNKEKLSVSNKDYKNTVCLFAVFLGLIIVYMCFSKVNTFLPTLTISSLLICIITICVFMHNQLLVKKQLLYIFKKSITNTTPLAITLLSIWGFVTILNQYLGFGRMVLMVLKQFHVTTVIIPTVVFISAALFSFITGSAYGSFNLFISLAAVLSTQLPSNMRTLTVSAAISGSLFAAFSFSSDTAMLCHDKTKCNLQDLRILQLSYALPLVIAEVISYLILGAIICNNCYIYLYIPICISIYLLIIMLQNIAKQNKYTTKIYLQNQCIHFQIVFNRTEIKHHNWWNTCFQYFSTYELYFRRKRNNKPLIYRAKCPSK